MSFLFNVSLLAWSCLLLCLVSCSGFRVRHMATIQTVRKRLFLPIDFRHFSGRCCWNYSDRGSGDAHCIEWVLPSLFGNFWFWVLFSCDSCFACFSTYKMYHLINIFWKFQTMSVVRRVMLPVLLPIRSDFARLQRKRKRHADTCLFGTCTVFTCFFALIGLWQSRDFSD